MLCDQEQIAPPLGASASPSAKWAAQQLGEERRHCGQGPVRVHLFQTHPPRACAALGSGNAAVSETARGSGLVEPMV